MKMFQYSCYLMHRTGLSNLKLLLIHKAENKLNLWNSEPDNASIAISPVRILNNQ